jgi:peptidoglycan/xylan/chitin deacetylase (PgdA/CDA1 family)
MSADSTEHDYYARDSHRALRPIAWPGAKPVALAFVVSVEYYDLYAPADAFVPPTVPGGFGRGPYPDCRAFSMRDYGSRVGIFRLIESFRRFGLKASLAADAFTAQHRPQLVEAALREGWDLLGHGASGTHVISSRMGEAEERDYIAASVAALTQLCGRPVLGWHGPEYGQSARTPRLLAELGLRHLLDWPCDERPVPMKVPQGTMLAIPMSADLDDVLAHWQRKISMQRWVASVLDAVDRLAIDGRRDGGRSLVLNLHPWLMGQPYRTTHLVELLQALARRDDIWHATTDDIAAWHASGHAAPDGPGREGG